MSNPYRVLITLFKRPHFYLRKHSCFLENGTYSPLKSDILLFNCIFWTGWPSRFARDFPWKDAFLAERENIKSFATHRERERAKIKPLSSYSHCVQQQQQTSENKCFILPQREREGKNFCCYLLPLLLLSSFLSLVLRKEMHQRWREVAPKSHKKALPRSRQNFYRIKRTGKKNRHREI